MGNGPTKEEKQIAEIAAKVFLYCYLGATSILILPQETSNRRFLKCTPTHLKKRPLVAVSGGVLIKLY